MPKPMKDPGQRRRYNQPARGEWVDLEPLEQPVLPEYPMAWTKRGAPSVPRWMWDLWRQDPVTSQWSTSDRATCLELGANFHDIKPELRLRMQTQLGLNAKGRRDLRWRLPVETKAAEQANEKAATVRRLRVVAEREAEKA